MTLKPTQIESRGIVTPGIGKRTTAHLNLTRSLADPPPPSEAMERAKERAALRAAFDEVEGRRHIGRGRRVYAGAEDGSDAA